MTIQPPGEIAVEAEKGEGVTCKYCGKTGLNWHGTPKGMRLGRDGVLHSCREFSKQAFKVCHDSQIGKKQINYEL